MWKKRENVIVLVTRARHKITNTKHEHDGWDRKGALYG
jgi:hypothetical protein